MLVVVVAIVLAIHMIFIVLCLPILHIITHMLYRLNGRLYVILDIDSILEYLLALYLHSMLPSKVVLPLVPSHKLVTAIAY